MYQQMLAYIPNDLRFDHLQGTSTAGGCRYRQAIPPGKYGRLYINTNYGIRKALLPQVPRIWTLEKSQVRTTIYQYINSRVNQLDLHGRLARLTSRVGLLFM